MNNRVISRAMMLTAAALLPLTAVGQDQPELVGVWEGSIRMPASEQAVTLTIEVADGRELTGHDQHTGPGRRTPFARRHRDSRPVCFL